MNNPAPIITYCTVQGGTVQIGGENSVQFADHSRLEERVDENTRSLGDQDSVIRQLEIDVDENHENLQQCQNQVQQLTKKLQNLELDNSRLHRRVSYLEEEKTCLSALQSQESFSDRTLVSFPQSVNATLRNGHQSGDAVDAISRYRSLDLHGPVARSHSNLQNRWHSIHGIPVLRPVARKRQLILAIEPWGIDADSTTPVYVIEVDDKMTVTELVLVMKTMVGIQASLCCIKRSCEGAAPLYVHTLDFDKRLNHYSIQDSDTLFYTNNLSELR